MAWRYIVKIGLSVSIAVAIAYTFIGSLFFNWSSDKLGVAIFTHPVLLFL